MLTIQFKDQLSYCKLFVLTIQIEYQELILLRSASQLSLLQVDSQVVKLKISRVLLQANSL